MILKPISLHAARRSMRPPQRAGNAWQRSWALPFAVLLIPAGVRASVCSLRALRLSASRTHLPFRPLIRTRPIQFFLPVARLGHPVPARSFSASGSSCQGYEFHRLRLLGFGPAGLPCRSNHPAPSLTSLSSIHFGANMIRPAWTALGFNSLSRVFELCNDPARLRAREVSRPISRVVAMTAKRQQNAALAEARRGIGRSCRAARWLFNPGPPEANAPRDRSSRRARRLLRCSAIRAPATIYSARFSACTFWRQSAHGLCNRSRRRFCRNPEITPATPQDRSCPSAY